MSCIVVLVIGYWFLVFRIIIFNKNVFQFYYTFLGAFREQWGSILDKVYPKKE
jgi:hypothetical protein